MKFTYAAIFVLWAGSLMAQPAGTLDPTFGNAGQVTTNITTGQDQARAATLQADGKILAAGFSSSNITGKDFCLVRYNTDGSLDNSFGNGGIVTTDVQLGSDDIAHSIALQTDGKIILAGESDNGSDKDAALIRYNTDGSLDTAFGSAGKVLTDFDGGQQDEIKVVKIHLLTGNILVGGSSIISSSLAKPVVARYTPDGALDTSFESNGIRLLWINSLDNQYVFSVEDLAVKSNGKVTAVGWRDFPGLSWDSDYFACRINSDGTMDATFSGDGVATYNGGFNGHDRAFSMILQPNDDILVAGGAYASNLEYDFQGFLINSDGTAGGFGSWNTVASFGGLSDDIAYGFAEDNDGNFILAGTVEGNTSSSFGIARFGATGNADSDWGGNGRITTTFGGEANNECHEVLVQTDNKVIAIGGSGDEFALARYLGEAMPQLDAFQLVSPANQATSLSFQSVVCNWTDAFGATAYEIEFDTTATFTGTPQTFSPSVSNQILTNLLGATTYHWRVRATDGTSFGMYQGPWSFTTETMVAALGEASESLVIGIFPNPSSGLVTVHSHPKKLGQSYQLLNNMGQEVAHGTLDLVYTKLDLSSFASGLYFLSVGEGEATFKIVKE